tara:strand:+ start:43 stop:597 length:555 start_codon:yes stop_codon:yes gene_type:complete
MGYKTKSMINAKGAYAGGNVDPMYDSAAYLKTNLTEAGRAFGDIAGQYYSEAFRKPRLEKRARKAESKGETGKAAKFRERSKRLYGEEKETPPTVENGEVKDKVEVKDNNSSDNNNINSDINTNPNSNYQDAIPNRLNEKDNIANEEITPSLSSYEIAERIRQSLAMKSDGFNRGMLRKNKYKK